MRSTTLLAELSLASATWLVDELIAARGLDSVRVELLPAHARAGRFARTDCRSFIQVQPGVPAYIVAHEVAHVAAGRTGHDARWLTEYVALLPVAAATLAARLASLSDGPTAAPHPPDRTR